MKPLLFVFLLSMFASNAAGIRNPGFHLLKPYESKPGEVVVHQSVSDSQNGTIAVTGDGTRKNGSISIKRTRTLERRVIGTGAKTKVQYQTLADLRTTSTRFGATKKTDKQNGVLLGKTVSGFRDAGRLWRLFPDQGTSDARLTEEISKLEAYENRRWFLSHPVKIGQSWSINPAFIRHLTERDLDKSEVRGLMTFKAIETIDNEATAILTFKVESAGKNVDSKEQVNSAARTSIHGVVHLSLETMLDKKLRMVGSLSTMARKDGKTTSVVLPVDMTVTKTIRK